MTVFQFSTPISETGATLAVRLRDGLASLRPLGPGEEEPLTGVFAGMSPDSRASRYLTGLSRLTPAMLRTLTAVDGHDHVAWLASIEGRPVGIGRFIRTLPGTAELAFEVVDAHHGRGIGSALLDALTTLAAVSGVQHLEATVLESNKRSTRLLERVGLTFRADQGTLEGTGRLRLLDPPRVDRPAVVRLAAAAGPIRPWSERTAGGQ